MPPTSQRDAINLITSKESYLYELANSCFTSKQEKLLITSRASKESHQSRLLARRAIYVLFICGAVNSKDKRINDITPRSRMSAATAI